MKFIQLIGLLVVLCSCSSSSPILSEESFKKVYNKKQKFNTQLISIFYKGDTEEARHFCINKNEYLVDKGAFMHIKSMTLKSKESDWKAVHLSKIEYRKIEHLDSYPRKKNKEH